MTLELYSEEELIEARKLSDDRLEFYRYMNSFCKNLHRVIRVGSKVAIAAITVVGAVGSLESLATGHDKDAADYAISCGTLDIAVYGTKKLTDFVAKNDGKTGALLTRVALERTENALGIVDPLAIPQATGGTELDI